MIALLADLAHLAQAVPAPTGADAAIPTPELVFQPILPEIVLCTAGILGMLYEAFARRGTRSMHLAIAMVGLFGAGFAAVRLWSWSLSRAWPRWVLIVCGEIPRRAATSLLARPCATSCSTSRSRSVSSSLESKPSGAAVP